MNQYRSLTLTVLVLLICSVAAVASEKFVLSATDGTNIILQKFELDQNQIKMIRSNVIETDDWIGNTAVTFRNVNNTLVFDVYYYACRDQNDLECVNATLSMKRVDSNLKLKFGQDFTIPVAYALATERLQKPSGLSLRLLLQNRSIVEERKLDSNGVPGPPETVVFRDALDENFYNSSAAEDGKMVVASAQKNGANLIAVRTFHSKGPIRVMQIEDQAWSPTLSGPVTRSSKSFQPDPLQSRIGSCFF